MAFPETQLTLIQRLVAGGGEVEWRLFLKDYWGPVCRFALRYGAGNMDDAEDVALETFEVLWSNHLLVRWMSNRSAKLRTLLCGVARNLLANRGRVRAGRERLGRQWLEQLDPSSGTTSEQDDVFYAAWAEDLVQQAVQSLVAEYYRDNKGDYVRVLYGRLCERLSIAEVAKALEIKVTDVVNYYRHTGQRLAENLRQRLRRQIHRYAAAEEAEAEFVREWAQLQEHLTRSGGLEKAVQRAYDLLDPVRLKEHRGPRLTQALERMTSLIHRSAPDGG